MKKSDKIRVLVLCTGNSCRSQIAEGFFRHFGNGKIEVKSAGLEPKGVNPLAIKVMQEIGIDISKQTSNHLKEYLNEEFDYVITVCDNAAANCPVWSKKPNPPTPFPEEEGGARGASHPERSRRNERLHWPFPDPAEAKGTDSEILTVFRKVRDDIGKKVKGWVENLK